MLPKTVSLENRPEIVLFRKRNGRKNKNIKKGSASVDRQKSCVSTCITKNTQKENIM